MARRRRQAGASRAARVRSADTVDASLAFRLFVGLSSRWHPTRRDAPHTTRTREVVRGRPKGAGLADSRGEASCTALEGADRYAEAATGVARTRWEAQVQAQVQAQRRQRGRPFSRGRVAPTPGRDTRVCAPGAPSAGCPCALGDLTARCLGPRRWRCTFPPHYPPHGPAWAPPLRPYYLRPVEHWHFAWRRQNNRSDRQLWLDCRVYG